MNRSSEPLDLGAWKSWDTPGKLCLTTIPSYWDQFWVVSPGWYESTLSTTPKTPRKVIPVKDSSGEKLGIGSSWANSKWKSHDPKWLDGPSCRRSWKFPSDLCHLDLFRACWMGLWKIAQIANVGMNVRCPAINIPTAWDILHYHPTCEHKNCYTDPCDSFVSSTWVSSL